jgi:hypothetical protein
MENKNNFKEMTFEDIKNFERPEINQKATKLPMLSIDEFKRFIDDQNKKNVFKMRNIGKRITVYQNWWRFEIGFVYSFDDIEKDANIFGINLLFWSIEIKW